MPSTHPGMEPPSGAGPDLPPYKSRVTAVCDGMVRSAGFEPATSSISGWPLYRIGVRAHGAATRCRPGPSAVRRRSRSRARRPSYRGWNRTSVTKVQSLDGVCQQPTRYWCGKRDLNPHATRAPGFEPGASTIPPPPHGAPPGPRSQITPGKSRVLCPLKLTALGAATGNRTPVRCSLGAVAETRTPSVPAWKAGALPVGRLPHIPRLATILGCAPVGVPPSMATPSR
jgi:hypothetical protein